MNIDQLVRTAFLAMDAAHTAKPAQKEQLEAAKRAAYENLDNAIREKMNGKH